MESVAIPQPAHIPSSPAIAGVFYEIKIFAIDSVFEAAVLSVGIYITSDKSHALWTTAAKSFVSVKEKRWDL